MFVRGARGCVLLAVIALSGGLFPGSAHSAPDAGGFLAELSDRAIAQMTEPGIDDTEKEQRFRVLIDEGFDIPAIGKFVVGRYWRGASAADQQDFLETFSDMMVNRFLPVFGEYSGEQLKVGSVRPFSAGSNIFNVSSELVRPEGEPFKVNWRILHTGGKFKIVDIIAEGVSIAVTLRSEYNSFLKNNDGSIAALTSLLRKKIKGG